MNVRTKNHNDANEDDDDGYSQFDIIQSTADHGLTETVLSNCSNSNWRRSARLGSSEWSDM